jgi:hypothetical protein
MLNGFLTEVRGTVVPGRDPRHGPLPPLLVAMTMVTGLVDACCWSRRSSLPR